MGDRGASQGRGEARRRRRSDDEPSGNEEGVGPAIGLPAEQVAPGTTGRYLVLLREDAIDAGVSAMAGAAGVTAVRTAEAEAERPTPKPWRARGRSSSTTWAWRWWRPRPTGSRR